MIGREKKTKKDRKKKESKNNEYYSPEETNHEIFVSLLDIQRILRINYLPFADHEHVSPSSIPPLVSEEQAMRRVCTVLGNIHPSLFERREGQERWFHH